MPTEWPERLFRVEAPGKRCEGDVDARHVGTWEEVTAEGAAGAKILRSAAACDAQGTGTAGAGRRGDHGEEGVSFLGSDRESQWRVSVSLTNLCPEDYFTVAIVNLKLVQPLPFTAHSTQGSAWLPRAFFEERMWPGGCSEKSRRELGGA